MIPLIESDTAHSQHAEARPASVQSPGLNQFRQNPFRVLRLPVAATSTRAVWKAEKVLTLVRAGMRLPGDDPLPWLAEADEIEVQEAAQKMEEPLRRLAEQLFWFDFQTDPDGDLLSRALRGDVRALSDALAIPEPKARVPSDRPHLIDDERVMILLRRINHANLRLIAGLAVMHGIGPRLVADGTTVPTETGTSFDTRWTKADGIQIVMNAHELLEKRGGNAVHPYEALLREALSRWTAILAEVALPALLRLLIGRLDDDLVTADDTETLAHAARTLLADILAGEIKACTRAGQMDRTASLTRIAGECGLKTEVWIHALKPLRHVFRSEVDDLAVLIVEPARASIENLRVYLKRLATLRDQWRAIDSSDLLSLGQTIDEGVLVAHDRIQAIQATVSVSELLAECDNLKELLTVAAEVAHSSSLKERLHTAAGRTCEHACHFCRKRKASEFPTVVERRKETGRTDNGNTVTIHYQCRYAIVPRCERCADLHEYFHHVFSAILVATIITCGIIVVPSVSAKVWGGIVLFVLFGWIVARAIPLGILIFVSVIPIPGWIAQRIAAYSLTPPGERQYNDIKSSVEWKELLAKEDGDTTDTTTTIHSTKNAITTYKGAN